MTSQRELEVMLRKLNRKELVEWLPEMRLGKPAYDFLVTSLRERAIGPSQSVNILQALFRLGHHSIPGEVAALLLERLADERIKVRSTAAKLLVGQLKLGELERTEPYTGALRDAQIRGMERATESLIRAFLASSS